MLFQILDQKGTCTGYYDSAGFHLEEPIPQSGATWDYSPHLKGTSVKLARLYTNGLTLTDACPPELQHQLEKTYKAMNTFFLAMERSKISLRDNCVYNLIPERFLYDFFEVKNQITEYILENFERPDNYDFLVGLSGLLWKIRQQPLNINTQPIKHLLGSVRGKNFLRTLRTAQPRCDYNPYGTVTGRLATHPNSFPILTMGKEFRQCVKPRNDWFIELDYNAAELRTLLALSGRPQPSADIHDWSVKNVFNNTLTRDLAKTKTFAWLYSNRSNKTLEKIYDKTGALKKYWDGTTITTEFGRVIKDVDKHRALNYIIQSSTIDMVHEQAIKIDQALDERDSCIALLIHDAVILDLKDEDKYELPDLIEEFSNTRFGKFKLNASAGKDLGNMKELKL